MNTPMVAQYHEWVAGQWASEREAGGDDVVPRWNKFEWVGDQGHGGPLIVRTAARMPEGETGLSGFRHTPAAARWASTR